MNTNKMISVAKAETVGSAPKVGDTGRYVDNSANGAWSPAEGYKNDESTGFALLDPNMAKLLKSLV
jgi:hypothetical protein